MKFQLEWDAEGLEQEQSWQGVTWGAFCGKCGWMSFVCPGKNVPELVPGSGSSQSSPNWKSPWEEEGMGICGKVMSEGASLETLGWEMKMSQGRAHSELDWIPRVIHPQKWWNFFSSLCLGSSSASGGLWPLVWSALGLLGGAHSSLNSHFSSFLIISKPLLQPEEKPTNWRVCHCRREGMNL